MKNSTAKKITTFLLSLCFSLGLFAQGRDSLTGRVIAFDSAEGQAMFKRSINQPFWKLIPYYEAQQNLSYCGIASSVMVLNALHIPAPYTPKLAPYALYTQDSFFTQTVVNEAFSPSDVTGYGVEFEEMAKALRTFGVNVELVYTSEFSEDEVRQSLIAALNTPDTYVIAFYLQKYLFGEGSGHVSPIAAYDKEADRFLLLEVAPFQRPPVWVKTKDLYRAMSLNFWGNEDELRGYLLVSTQGGGS